LKEKPGICPLCKRYQEKNCSPMFYALLCKFKIQCENKHNGCNEVLLYESLEKHQNEQCQYQMKACRGCQKNMLKKDLEKHEQICGEIQIECIRCKFVDKRKRTHEQFDCIMNMLDQNNKKLKVLEKVVKDSQLNIQKLQATANLHFTLGFAPGIFHNISISSILLSWNIIYDFPYNHETTIEELRALRPQCTEQIIVGAIKGNSSMILTIGALGPADILLLNNLLNQPTRYGNVHWYLTPTKSFGFAPSTTTIKCNNADYVVTDNSNNRLSWHLDGSGGYRAGTVIDLDENNEWRKIIMTEKDIRSTDFNQTDH
jgi:hypothetical protein